MKLRVACYAGGRADERPVRFQLEERDYIIEEVLDASVFDVASDPEAHRLDHHDFLRLDAPATGLISPSKTSAKNSGDELRPANRHFGSKIDWNCGDKTEIRLAVGAGYVDNVGGL